MHAFNHGRTVPTTATMQKVVGCCPARPGQIFDHQSTVKSLLDTGDATNTTARTDHGSITRAGCHRSSGVGASFTRRRTTTPAVPKTTSITVASPRRATSGRPDWPFFRRAIPCLAWRSRYTTNFLSSHPTSTCACSGPFFFFLSITYPFWLARHILAMGGENRIALDKQVTIRVTDCNICSHKLAHKQDQPALTTNKSTRPPTMGVAFLQF